MKYDYDYIIIGSGFGGSVSALRLAEKGYKVLVVEKGKWFSAEDFPKTNWQLRKWLWWPLLRFYGIMRLNIFRHVSVLSGTGVGGGSLVYANTLPIPKENFYKTGSWVGLADWKKELNPYYKKALKMLGAAPNPKLYDGDLALQKLAESMNRGEHFEYPDVAVYFGDSQKEVDPYFEGEGPLRTACTFCGACMTGCRHNAKNTLDKNYLFFAQKKGAKILAEQEVIDVKPIDKDVSGSAGYEVVLRSSTRFFKKKQNLKTKGVIFSGGVLGSVKLLLKLKNSFLPHLSERVGYDIRTNNETLISVSTLDKDKDMSKGVAIGSLLHTDADSHLEVVRYGEGSGFWRLLHLPFSNGKTMPGRLLSMLANFVKNFRQYLKIYTVRNWAKSTVVLLFMQTLDSTLRLKRGFFGRTFSGISTGKAPSPDIPESKYLTEKYSEIVKGKPTSFVLETLAGISSTAHILGGAVMGADNKQGVVNAKNEVFGYDNMYVIDGSVISANPGVNPSLSITAIAERAMDLIPPKKH